MIPTLRSSSLLDRQSNRRSDAEHLGTLVTFLTSFGDVRTAKDTLALLGAGAKAAAQ